jgi:hypothetical protein
MSSNIDGGGSNMNGRWDSEVVVVVVKVIH